MPPLSCLRLLPDIKGRLLLALFLLLSSFFALPLFSILIYIWLYSLRWKFVPLLFESDPFDTSSLFLHSSVFSCIWVCVLKLRNVAGLLFVFEFVVGEIVGSCSRR